MTPCTTQSSFGRAMPIAMATLRSRNHVQLTVLRSVRWTFDVDHVTIAETHIAMLTVVRNYCSELRQTSTLVPLTQYRNRWKL